MILITFSVAVIKYHDQKQLKKAAYNSRGLEYGMAAEVGSQLATLQAHTSDILPLARCHLLKVL